MSSFRSFRKDVVPSRVDGNQFPTGNGPREGGDGGRSPNLAEAYGKPPAKNENDLDLALLDDDDQPSAWNVPQSHETDADHTGQTAAGSPDGDPNVGVDLGDFTTLPERLLQQNEGRHRNKLAMSASDIKPEGGIIFGARVDDSAHADRESPNGPDAAMTAREREMNRRHIEANDPSGRLRSQPHRARLAASKDR